MKTIKYWESYNERTDTHYYNEAIIVDELPSVGDHVSYIYDDEIVIFIGTALMDCEQPTSAVWDYDFFEVGIEDAENYENTDCIVLAVKRGDDE